MRVLLVDDQEIFLQALCDLLSVRGHEVVGTATSGAAALEAVAQTNPDVVLVDIRLSNESGLDIARALTTAHHELAVVLMSMSQIAAVDIRAFGARSVITKEQLSRVDLEALTQIIPHRSRRRSSTRTNDEGAEAPNDSAPPRGEMV